MHKCLLFLLCLFLIPAAPSLAEQPKPVNSSIDAAWVNLYPFDPEFEWNCPETDPKGAGKKVIKFKINLTQKPAIDTGEYKKFLGQLLKEHPHIDYFECAQAFTKDVLKKFEFTSEEFIGVLKSDLPKMNAFYGYKSHSQDALSPITPGEPVTMPLPTAQMMENLRTNCGEGMDATYLDGNFLKGLTKENLKFDGFEVIKPDNEKGSLVIISGKWIKPHKSQSVLYPAHFRALTKPGCVSENRLYYKCASQSMVTSRGSFGSGKCAVSLPEECTKGESSWLR